MAKESFSSIKNSNFEIVLTRFIVLALFIGVISTVWDVWWHVFVGRETFFEPPHISLYAFIGAAIIAGVYGWYRIREKVWKRLAIILLIVPLSAPFDEFWHRLFGKEDLSSLFIIWSPPHIALVFAIIISLISILPLVQKEKDMDAKRLFGSLIFAAILILSIGLAAPFEPLGLNAVGTHAVIGFWGAGIIAAVFSWIILAAQRWIMGTGEVAMVVILYLFLYSLSHESGEVASGIIIQPYASPPLWITAFSFIVPAILIDLIESRPAWLRGAIVGGVWAGILYGFAHMFIEPEFKYGAQEALTAIGTSLLGGALGGVLVSIFEKRWPSENHKK